MAVTAPPKKLMSSWARTVLMIYFFILIASSIYFLVLIWNPVQQSLDVKKINKTTITTPEGNTITIITTENNTTKIVNMTSTVVSPNHKKTTTENFSSMPLSGQALATDTGLLFTNREIRLIILATLFGVLGACAQGIASLTQWIGTRKLEEGWGLWYFTRPAIGATLAIITYLVLRAGLVTGQQGVMAFSDYGVAGISAIVGLMTDEMTRKLRDIFDTLFGISKPDKEKGEHPSRAANIRLEAGKTVIKVNDVVELKATTIKDDGSPAKGAQINFVLSDTNIVDFDQASDKKKAADSLGVATVKLKGKNIGKMTVVATAMIEGETQETKSDSVTIEVMG